MKITAAEVKAIRAMSGMSQGSFADAIHLSPWTLRKWEQGTRQPDDAAITLLRLIEQHPRALDRIKELKME